MILAHYYLSFSLLNSFWTWFLLHIIDYLLPFEHCFKFDKVNVISDLLQKLFTFSKFVLFHFNSCLLFPVSEVIMKLADLKIVHLHYWWLSSISFFEVTLFQQVLQSEATTFDSLMWELLFELWISPSTPGCKLLLFTISSRRLISSSSTLIISDSFLQKLLNLAFVCLIKIDVFSIVLNGHLHRGN